MFLKKKICFIKEGTLSKSGLEIRYYTEIGGLYVSNSMSESKEEAESFFEQVLKNNGIIKQKEILRKEYK